MARDVNVYHRRNILPIHQDIILLFAVEPFVAGSFRNFHFRQDGSANSWDAERSTANSNRHVVK